MRDPEKTIGNLIDNTSNAFICYIDDLGFPVTKAMLKPRIRKGIKEFYFTTNTSSNKVKCLKNNNVTSLYFIDKRFYRGVSLIGTAEILEDVETKKMIWQTGDEKYYHGGVEDPDYCVIKIIITHGRFYSSFKNENFDV